MHKFNSGSRASSHRTKLRQWEQQTAMSSIAIFTTVAFLTTRSARNSKAIQASIAITEAGSEHSTRHLGFRVQAVGGPLSSTIDSYILRRALPS